MLTEIDYLPFASVPRKSGMVFILGLSSEDTSLTQMNLCGDVRTVKSGGSY